MSLLRAAPSDWLQRGLAVGALAGTAVLTLVDRGTTRMYAMPWYLLFLAVQVAPLLLLALRAGSSSTPLRLPPRRWALLAAIAATAVLLTSTLSPYQGPSLLAALTPLAAIATFCLVHDWLATDPARNAPRLQRLAGFFSLAIVAASLGPWLIDVVQGRWWTDLAALAQRRNAHPLGHANYTAGLALLTLPWLGSLARCHRGRARWGWAFATALALAMLLTSSSRGGMVGFCAVLCAVLFHARPSWKALLIGGVGALAVAIALVALNPRTRTLLLRQSQSSVELSSSTSQRTAMLTAGARMGRERPSTGWGTGTTALAYPRQRAGLDGGAENVLQLHNTPVQLWADYGIPGVVVAVGFLGLVLSASTRHRGDPFVRPASIVLAGYLTFALFDFNLDVPVFALALATAAAVLAAADPVVHPPSRHSWIAIAALAALGLVAAFGHRDPTPALNVRALADAPTHPERAIATLRESLQLNPDQEIAHFNLGWLLVVSAPSEAERHFLAAARLVPDKGGVYFGLALARRNQRADDANAGAEQALALECLNDPLFLTSPWWRNEAVAALRPAAMRQLEAMVELTARKLESRQDPRAREAHWVAALAAWIDGRDAPGQMLSLAHTAQRVRYFVDRPTRPDFDRAPVRAYRRERTGYPVLMRNLDLPPPRDLFDVQENSVAAGELSFLFPAKGWLPGPLLRELLDPTVSAMP